MLNNNKKNNLESGLNHWLYQKVTAVLLIPITIWVLLKLPKFMQLSSDNLLKGAALNSVQIGESLIKKK